MGLVGAQGGLTRYRKVPASDKIAGHSSGRQKTRTTWRKSAATRSMQDTGPTDASFAQQSTLLDRRLAVAPMMDWTDRHCRFFLRQFSPRVLLYTEMITAAAILRGRRERLLAFDPAEHPVALQLGGSEPDSLAAAARYGAEAGYDEINLNVGCPSERVQSGAFGACLMAEPALVARCVEAMQAAVAIPVTVKCRIGIDDHDEYSYLANFVDVLAAAGARVFIVHARKAILKGLSPKQNREVPPLRYDYVERLKRERPDLTIVLNGGLRSADEVLAALARVDGVMLGREAYHNPYVLSELHGRIYGEESWQAPTPAAIMDRLIPYVEQRCAAGDPLSAITRHFLGLFAGRGGARSWRRYFTECARKPGAGAELVVRARDRLRSIDPLPPTGT
jgi:tRNA-dihydrouridine synthase A